MVVNNAEQEKLIKTMERKINKQEKEIRSLKKDIEGFKGQVIEFEVIDNYSHILKSDNVIDQGKGPC